MLRPPGSPLGAISGPVLAVLASSFGLAVTVGPRMSPRIDQALQLLKGIPAIALVQLLRGIPGILLVAAGGVSIYFAVISTEGATPASMTYVVLGFGFLLAVAGLIVLFRELGQGGTERAGFDPAKAASDLERVLGQLGKNYDILRQQTKAGFVLAALFMALGILVILGGSIGQLFGFTVEPSGMTVLAGVIVEAVSVIGFYLFRVSFRELTETSERLHSTLLLLDAFRRADGLPEEERTRVTVDLIDRLVEYAREHRSEAQVKAA